MQRVKPAWFEPVMLILTLLICVSPAVAEEIDHPTLQNHMNLLDRLTVTPGSSGGAAAGLVNPAVWGANPGGGGYLDYYDPAVDAADGSESRDILGVAELGPLGFGVNYRDWDPESGPGHTNYFYTLGLGLGNRSGGLGLSYAWSKGGHGLYTPRELFNMGLVVRRSLFSLGVVMSHDFESEDRIWQADLGLRPLGPRLTLFGGVSYVGTDDDKIPGTDDEYDKFAFNFGLDAKVLPGMAVAAGMRDTGEFSLGLSLSFGGPVDGRTGVTKLGARYLADDEQEHAGTVYTFETGRDNSLLGFLAKPEAFPEMSFSDGSPYRVFRLFDDRTTFLANMERLSAMAANANIGGVLINLSGVNLSPAKAWELRAQLEGFRNAGKRVVIYFDRLGMFEYMLANVADELWMDPWGDLDIRGIGFGMTYVADMLEKVGVGFQEFRFFKYKSAMETFSRMEMSDGQREQLEMMCGDWFEELVRTTCEARGITRAQWDALMNEKGEIIADEALAAGLIDRIGDFHDARKATGEVERRGTRAGAMADIAGFGGDRRWADDEWGEAPRIAVLYAIGGCSMYDGIQGVRLSREIRRLRDDDRVKAIVLRSDSPGGDPLPSDLVSRELKLTQEVKPVVVSQGMVAASGGYWISMHSDRILASPLTITGSIGVISGHFYDKAISEKVGMNYQGIQFGDHADLYGGANIPFIGLGLPHRPATDAEIERSKTVMLDLYDKFVANVAEGRGLNPEAVREIAQGRVWTGNQGLENGLVDEIGGLWDSIHRARELAGLADDERIEIVQGPGLGLFGLPDFNPLNMLGVRWFGGGATEAPADLLTGAFWDTLDANERVFIEQMLAHPGSPVLVMDPITVNGAGLNP